MHSRLMEIARHKVVRTSSTRGSPYPFNTHVPIRMYDLAWIGKGRIDTPIEVIDIA